MYTGRIDTNSMQYTLTYNTHAHACNTRSQRTLARMQYTFTAHAYNTHAHTCKTHAHACTRMQYIDHPRTHTIHMHTHAIHAHNAHSHACNTHSLRTLLFCLQPSWHMQSWRLNALWQLTPWRASAHSEKLLKEDHRRRCLCRGMDHRRRRKEVQLGGHQHRRGPSTTTREEK